jgi:hypothetical protein
VQDLYAASTVRWGGMQAVHGGILQLSTDHPAGHYALRPRVHLALRIITCIAGWMIVAVMNPIDNKIKLIRLDAAQSLYADRRRHAAARHRDSLGLLWGAD